MSADLIEKLNAALDARERAIEGSGYLGWLTYRHADGSMHYTTAAGSQPLEEPHWVVDGKEATGYSGVQVVHDEAEARRQVAAHRKILGLHQPFVADESDGDAICQTCLEGSHLYDVSAYPCPTLKLMAEAYGIEVES